MAAHPLAVPPSLLAVALVAPLLAAAEAPAWRYDAESQRIVDGTGWEVAVRVKTFGDVTGYELTDGNADPVKAAPKDASGAWLTELDLTGPVDTGVPIVSVGSYSFRTHSGLGIPFSRIRLPGTIVNIADHAFEDCATVEVFEPHVFTNLVHMGRQSGLPRSFFAEPSLSFPNPAFAEFPMQAWHADGPKTVVLGPGVTALGDYAFDEYDTHCPVDVYLAGDAVPATGTDWHRASGAVRVLVPVSSRAWEDYADVSASEPTAAQREAYAKAFPDGRELWRVGRPGRTPDYGGVYLCRWNPAAEGLAPKPVVAVAGSPAAPRGDVEAIPAAVSSTVAARDAYDPAAGTAGGAFAILPPGCRGRVSTRRRRSDVLVDLRGPAGASWRLVAKDAAGAVVASAEGSLADGAATAALPVPRNAPAGDYRLEAKAALPGGGTAEAACALRVVAPEKGQLLVDQDGFLLNEGERWFPLGVYHCHTWNWDEPVDETGLRARDMGFDWMQIWSWDWQNHLSGDRAILAEFVDASLQGEAREAAIDALAATNRANREALEGVALCYEAGEAWNAVISLGPDAAEYPFERDERFARWIASASADPSRLVRMWYFADEAGGDYHRGLRRAADFYARHDPRGLPAFNLGNLAAVTAGEYGGNDIYVRYGGATGTAAAFADRVEALRRDHEALRRRPFVVPQAFGQSERQPSETPAFVRAEAYLACIGGASGIGFYCWKQTGDWSGAQKQGMGWNPATAHVVKDVVAEIKTFRGALMSGAETRLRSPDGAVRALLCGDAESGRFLIAASTLEAPADATLADPALAGLSLEPLFGAPEPRVSGGSVSFPLPALGTAVWRVKQ